MEILIFSIDDEIIDIEWCYINGHTPPKDRKYRYKVDKEYFVTHHHEMTGEQILEKTGKNSKDYILRQKNHGNWITIEPKQEVDFTKHGIEKFKTIKNEHTEGELGIIEKAPRRGFSLLEEDEEYVIALNLLWETIQVDKVQWLFIHDYPIPAGYNTQKVILAIQIAANYPTAQLDMLYFFPAIFRLDGMPIGAVTEINLDGKIFQQWSRHRTQSNPWRPDIDNLSTHIPLAEVWLNNEFIKKPSHEVRA